MTFDIGEAPVEIIYGTILRRTSHASRPSLALTKKYPNYVTWSRDGWPLRSARLLCGVRYCMQSCSEYSIRYPYVTMSIVEWTSLFAKSGNETDKEQTIYAKKRSTHNNKITEMHTNIKHSPEGLTRHCEWHQIYDKNDKTQVWIKCHRHSCYTKKYRTYYG